MPTNSVWERESTEHSLTAFGHLFEIGTREERRLYYMAACFSSIDVFVSNFWFRHCFLSLSSYAMCMCVSVYVRQMRADDSSKYQIRNQIERLMDMKTVIRCTFSVD